MMMKTPVTTKSNNNDSNCDATITPTMTDDDFLKATINQQ